MAIKKHNDNISDLNVETTLFPLLNFTNNKYAEKTLMEMLSAPINNLDEVMERQAILKALSLSLSAKTQEQYYPSDILEVYEYSINTNFQNYNLHSNSLTLKIRFSELLRQKLTAKFIQVTRLFIKINRELSYLQRKEFPLSYQNEIGEMQTYLNDFNVYKVESLLKSTRIQPKVLVKFLLQMHGDTESKRIDKFWNAFFKYGALLSLCIAINRNGFSFPVFNNDIFEIRDLYHPCIHNPIKNTIAIKNTVSLITGPNMSGKSTFLKSIGICVYLASIGMAVPAMYCEIPYFDSVFVHINHTDDLKSGYSHFMSEIMNLKKALIEVNNHKRCFAVFDELFNGTNYDDALAITKTAIAGLKKYSGSFFLLSTHKYQLKELTANSSSGTDIFHLQCNMTDNLPVFTYKLKTG